MKTINKSRWIEKLLVAVLLLAMSFQMGGMDSRAATLGWSLRYAKGAPSSVQKTSWKRSVKTTQNQLSMKVSSFRARDTKGGNNGWLHITSTGELNVFVNKAVKKNAPKKVKKNSWVTGSVTITNPNILYNCNASGSYIY